MKKSQQRSEAMLSRLRNWMALLLLACAAVAAGRAAAEPPGAAMEGVATPVQVRAR